LGLVKVDPRCGFTTSIAELQRLAGGTLTAEIAVAQ